MQILADAMLLQQRETGSVIQCPRIMRLLKDFGPVEASANPLLDLMLERHMLPVELAIHIDDLVPRGDDEVVRRIIIDVCAQSARSWHSVARATLHSACLRPQRLGFHGAQAFATVVDNAGGRAMARVLAPFDFVAVGQCLRDSVAEEPDRSTSSHACLFARP